MSHQKTERTQTAGGGSGSGGGGGGGGVVISPKDLTAVIHGHSLGAGSGTGYHEISVVYILKVVESEAAQTVLW